MASLVAMNPKRSSVCSPLVEVDLLELSQVQKKEKNAKKTRQTETRISRENTG